MWSKQEDKQEENWMEQDEEKDIIQMRSRVIVPGVPGFCHQPPQTGFCKGYWLQWFYSPETRSCSRFVWGMCGGNKNRFNTADECYRTCAPDQSPCHQITCPKDKPVCHLKDEPCMHKIEIKCELTPVCQDLEQPYLVQGVYMPRCFGADHTFSYKQCHGPYCWCVDTEGVYLDGFTNRNSEEDLVCDAKGQVVPETGTTLTLLNCPDGSAPNRECLLNACVNQICPGHPDATCQVDLCSPECHINFVDKRGSKVACGGDRCKVFAFERSKSDECEDDKVCPGGQVKTCPDSVCDSAAAELCPNNPCAVCMVDPCTCQPYFVHMDTKKTLTVQQCKFLSLGVCQVKYCMAKQEREKAGLSRQEEFLPQCEINGSFKSRQCDGDECFCVKEDGSFAAEDNQDDDQCRPIEKTEELDVTLTYKGDLADLQDNMVEDLKAQIKQILQAKGIKNVKIGEPYAGSIKVNLTLTKDEENVVDLSLAKTAIQQAIATGDLDLVVGNKPLKLAEGTMVARTAAQTQTTLSPALTTVQPDPTTKPSVADTESDSPDVIIIIACVVAVLGVLIIVVIITCYCHRKKKAKTDQPTDDNYDHIRVSDSKSNPPVYNKAFEPDQPDHVYDKIKI